MNQIVIRNGFLVTIALLLAGCAGLHLPNLTDNQEERQVIQLINYAQRVASMTAEQQRIEYSAGNQAFARDKDAISRVRLALLLATPGASFSDAGRAASLLEPMATPSDAASPLHSLARLLYAQLNERASEQKRANQMREQVEARKEAARALREQLEALKEVERTIIERGQESQPRRR
jgi:hypothetical protein